MFSEFLSEMLPHQGMAVQGGFWIVRREHFKTIAHICRWSQFFSRSIPGRDNFFTRMEQVFRRARILGVQRTIALRGGACRGRALFNFRSICHVGRGSYTPFTFVAGGTIGDIAKRKHFLKIP